MRWPMEENMCDFAVTAPVFGKPVPPDPLPQNRHLNFYAISRWQNYMCLFLATIPRESCRGFALFYV